MATVTTRAQYTVTTASHSTDCKDPPDELDFWLYCGIALFTLSYQRRQQIRALYFVQYDIAMEKLNRLLTSVFREITWLDHEHEVTHDTTSLNWAYKRRRHVGGILKVNKRWVKMLNLAILMRGVYRSCIKYLIILFDIYNTKIL